MNNLKKANRNAVYLRFTDDEIAELKTASEERGEKIQSILKRAFFNGEVKRPIMNTKNSTMVVTELKRIGNNINQIAKHLNSGFRSGWNDSVERCSNELTEIRRALVSHVVI